MITNYDEHRVQLREADIDRRFEAYLTPQELEELAERGQNCLLKHIDDDRILERAREIEATQQASEMND